MRLIRIAAATLNQTPLDWEGNARRIRDRIDEARGAGAGLLCMPEMAVTGYGCEDAFLSAHTHQRAWRSLLDLLPATRGLAVCLGLPVLHQKGLFNAVALVADGALLGLVAKRHLAGDGIHYEPRWFKAWPPGLRDTFTAPDGARLPMGDLIFDLGGVRVGLEICEDAWVASRPGAALAAQGVDIILNPSASHFAFGKIEVRKRFVIEGSRAFGTAYAYANLLGNESGRAVFDGGALIACAGTLLATGPRLEPGDGGVTSAVVDLDQVRMGQARTASFQPDLARDNPLLVEAPFAWPAAAPDSSRPAPAAWETGPAVKEEEFTRAVTLAMYDYGRKSRSAGFVVSLSGGADSAAVAALVHLMVRRLLDALGPGALAAAFGGNDAPGADAKAWTNRLLTTVYQAADNSGPVTRAAARAVAESVGARHLELEVGDLVRAYETQVSAALGLELNWSAHDIARQNIQARARSPGVWMITNLLNALLLCTSNRSEAAVGYATMDGDTSGGLCPIGGIDKAFLRHWLRWLETTGPDGVGPLPALRAVNAQQPTAELRPPDQAQTDEGDLMPYPVLDAIERAAIRDKQSPLEVLAVMRAAFPALAEADLRVWIDRFFRLWSRNQWKRERYAPSFHLDDENLDPKTWCRWPILSSGFAEELRELKGTP